MKRSSSEQALAFMVIAAIMLAGCATSASAKSGIVLDDIYTSVAMTVEAQTTPLIPTATATPTSTSVPTATPYASPTITPTSISYGYSYPYSGGCDNAAYVSDVTVPDGTEVAPGETFTKTWELLNTGTCTWSKKYAVFFVNGDAMDGSATRIQHTVAPGETADISVELTAPDESGIYTGYWMMEDYDGPSFGEEVYVQITVTEDAATSTPTLTPTSAASPTATPAAASTVAPSPTREYHRRHPTTTPTVTPGG
jgi:hypothetical protein